MYSKNVSYPQWLNKPLLYKILEYDLPFQMTQKMFETFINRSQIEKKMIQFNRKLNEEKADEEKADGNKVVVNKVNEI